MNYTKANIALTLGIISLLLPFVIGALNNIDSINRFYVRAFSPYFFLFLIFLFAAIAVVGLILGVWGFKAHKGKASIAIILCLIAVIPAARVLVDIGEFAPYEATITGNHMLCGTMSVTLPEEFMALEKPSGAENADKEGCYMDSYVGGAHCTCYKQDPFSGGFMLFSAVEAARSIPDKTPRDATFWEEFSTSFKHGLEQEEILSEKYGTFLGYPSYTLTTTGQFERRVVVEEHLFFTRNSKIYNLSFVALPEAHDSFWPRVKESIEDLSFTDQ
ncbi:MAG: hypothetical protein WD049_01685 [Candidatus Paceibacterota bacterium]